MTQESILNVHEIFFSVQGESSWMGFPCVFVRLSGCKHGCRWCDTPYARKSGHPMTIPQVLGRIASYKVGLVEVTGGEPLEQEAVYPLMRALIKTGYRVLLETNGSIDISRVPRKVVKIIDVKCPSSGRERRNLWSNLQRMASEDEIKFVIRDKKDYRFAKRAINQHQLASRRILFSPLHGRLDARRLAEWIMKDRLTVRLQIQLHKYLWGPKSVGR